MASQIGTLVTFVQYGDVVAADVNQNFADIKTAFNGLVTGANVIAIDTIAEATATHGVEIDGVLLKDNRILVYDAVGAAYMSIRSLTSDATLYIQSNVDDVGGEESRIIFQNSSSLTDVWLLGKDASHNFVLYDYDSMQNVLTAVPSGGMTLAPANGLLTVSGALTVAGPLIVGDVGYDYQYLSVDDVLAASGIFAVAAPTAANIDHIWFDDTDNVWHLCADTTRKATGNARLQVGAGAADDLAIRIGDSNIGLYRVAANTLGVSTYAGNAVVTFYDAGVANTRQMRTIIGGTAAFPPIAILYDDTGLYSISSSELGFTADGHACMSIIYGSGGAGSTRVKIWDYDNGQLEQVSVGAADSGGTGYKVLRIPN